MHTDPVMAGPSSSNCSDALSCVQQLIAAIFNGRVEEQRTYVERLNCILLVRPDLSSVTRYYVPLSKSKGGHENTKQFLKALEVCDNNDAIIMLCRIAHSFLVEDNFKGKLARQLNIPTKGSNNAVRRQKRLVKADGCSYCIRSLRFRLQAVSVDVSDKGHTANDALASTILAFGAKDPRLTLKLRLGGILPSLCALVYSKKDKLPSPTILKLLCRAVRSPRNAQLCGRQPDFAASIVSRMTLLSQSSTFTELMLLSKYLELLYFIIKNRKTRVQLVQDGVVSRVLALVVRHLDQRQKAGARKYTDNGVQYSLSTLHTELCLVAIAILRALANNKKAKVELVSLGAIAMCERTVGVLSTEQVKFGQNVVEKELQDSLCALCLRCLPTVPFPLAGISFPVRFAMPRADTSNRRRSISKSPLKPQIASSPSRNHSDSEKMKSFDDTMSSDDDCIDEEDTVFCLDDSEIMSSDDDEREIVDRGRSETAPTHSRLRSSELSLYDNFFVECTEGASSTGPSSNWTTYSDAIERESQATCSVMPISCIAYPDSVDSDVDRIRQPLAPSDDSMKEMVVQHMARSRIRTSFEPLIVFDLDQLNSDQKFASGSAPCEAPLTCEDRNMVGKIDSEINHLVFESRFESGNLRRATQISPNHYELVLSPDVNQLKDHYQWFYFRVANIQPNMPYTFEIVNCLKTTSMYSKGMQPVMYSVREAMSGRGGWFRGGEGVCYYRNLYAVAADDEESNPIASTSAADGEKGKKKHYFYSIRFNMTFANKGDVCYMAYHYPYTYSYLNVTIDRCLYNTTSSVYCRRDVIGHSLGGNPIPMLTITAPGSQNDVAKRETILLTGRVHPGESNASWMMHGILESLLCNSDQFSELLSQFVVKLIPMLNPDGVINGSHRCSLAGIDLNRVWDQPDRTIHPEIYHTKGILQYLTESRNRPPWVYVDLHGHSRRSNIFVFGNNPEESYLASDKEHLPSDGEFMVLPEILDKTALAFSLKNCRFDITRGKEASARQAVWRQFGIPRAYTMEATYCGFDTGAYKGFQIGIQELKDMGRDLLNGIMESYRTHLAGPTTAVADHRQSKQTSKKISIVGRKSRVAVPNSPNNGPSGSATTIMAQPDVDLGGREVGE